MAESSTASAQSDHQPFESTYSNTNTNTNNNRQNRKEKFQPMQISSQDARYNQQTQQHNQQYYQHSQQQWYPQNMYNDESYYRPPYARGGYNNRYQHNNYSYYQSQQQRRPHYRYPNTHFQASTRPNSNPLARSRNEPENLRSSLTNQLLENTYECTICTVKINRDQEIWSCDICFIMFHFTCIREWAGREESGTDKNWRCPGCQYSYSIYPKYMCFCRKRTNPPFQPGEIPHSCGELCNKRLNTKSNDCSHHCSELCHPGPCQTCAAVIKRSCLCGKESRLVTCGSSTIIKCENSCGKLKSCQHHTCDLICHPRECEPCNQLITQICISHGRERKVPCSMETGGTSTYKCGQICNKLLSCGQHQCTKTCHDGPCPECLLLPKNCETCACGKTTMDNQYRTSCIDPLPTCEKICDKILSCGPNNDHHRCLTQCHNGLCPPCDKQSILECRCRQLTKSTTCIDANQYDPIKNPFCCERKCNKKKMCGKHRCTELCCDRDVHICEVICGKTLNCGVHTCEELCHKNACRKCLVNSYDELTCRCGQTIIQPPVPCGTKPPSCNYVCNRTHTCDHPVYHSCHNDDECTPCAYLVSKLCVGEHAMRNNVPCHLKEVLCGQPCGKLLACDVHNCQRSCHSGLCQTVGQKCTQRCAIKRRDCGHSCSAPCHGHNPCPISICREMIKIRCPCGRLEKDIVCNVKPNESNDNSNDDNLAQSLTQALSVRTIDLSLQRKQQQQQQQQQQVQLDCDDECRIIQRNKAFAQALSINPDETRVTLPSYTDFLRDYARKNLEFIQTIERQFAQLVDETRRNQVTKRCHSFKPMKINERHAIHELAEHYGLETHALDPEPHRNVVAYATLGMCKIPSVLLSETIRRERLKVPPPVTQI